MASGINPLNRWSPAVVPGCGCTKLSSITWNAITPTAARKSAWLVRYWVLFSVTGLPFVARGKSLPGERLPIIG